MGWAGFARYGYGYVNVNGITALVKRASPVTDGRQRQRQRRGALPHTPQGHDALDPIWFSEREK